MNSANIVLKATDACNLRCKYCYNSETGYENKILPLPMLEKFLTVVSSKYNIVDIIWHGGEPMTVGVEYMEEAMKIEEKICLKTNVTFNNRMQSNGTLITNEWIKFFKNHSFKLGISFDGINNEKYRQKSADTLNGIELLKKNGIPFGIMAIVSDSDYDLMENYKYFAKMNTSVEFSPVFIEGAAKNLHPLSVEKYCKGINDLFDYWLYDKNGVGIRLFESYISMTLNRNFKICAHASCIGKYFSVTADGTIYNCGRESVKKYPFGNIENINSIQELFAGDGFKNLLTGSIIRREKCKKSCELFDYCCGNCTDEAIAENGLEEIPTNACYRFKAIFLHVKNSIEKVLADKIPLDMLNPTVKKTIIKCFAVNNSGVIE